MSAHVCKLYLKLLRLRHTILIFLHNGGPSRFHLGKFCYDLGYAYASLRFSTSSKASFFHYFSLSHLHTAPHSLIVAISAPFFSTRTLRILSFVSQPFRSIFSFAIRIASSSFPAEIILTSSVDSSYR